MIIEYKGSSYPRPSIYIGSFNAYVWNSAPPRLLPICNFKAKTKVFDRVAKTRVFDFTAKIKVFDRVAKTRVFNSVAKAKVFNFTARTKDE